MKKTAAILSCFFAGIICIHAQIPAATKEAFFKDWNYSPTAVFGLVKLDNISERSYYKLVKTDAATTKVYSYNAAGIQTGTVTFRFVNGKLNQMARTDRWGDIYEITKFTVTAPDQFMVTRKSSGKNSFFPCKGALYIYKTGLLSEVRYMDFNNKLSPYSDGVAIIRYKRYTDKNRYSLTNEAAYFDENNKPIISQTSDYHKIVYEYDNRGNQLTYAYYGTDNEPLTNRFGAFKRKNEYDSYDRLLRGTSIGLNDEPAANSYGIAGTSYEYRNGLQSKSTRFDDHFKTVRASAAGDGIAILKYEYDDRGNETKLSYFDENDQPINGQAGYHSISNGYDPLDMMISESYYDKYGNPATNRDNIHQYKYVRDDKGRLIQQSYYDNSNKAIKDPSDEAYMVKYRYDEQGRKVSESYWENSTTKMDRWNGYHEDIVRYNEDGREIEYAYYGQDGKLYLSTSGYSRVVNVYAPNARLIERKYLNDKVGMSMANSLVNNYSSIKFAYDERGRINNLRYFDSNGSPASATTYLNNEDINNFHRIEFIYTGNRIIEQRFYTAGNDTPFKILDCLKQDYITTSGVSEGHKNQ